MAQTRRASPARAFDHLGVISSPHVLPVDQGLGLDDETARLEDEGETVDSVMSKLAIERRVQYGAEKMLDVIEKRAGEGEGSEQDQVKARITVQLEAANEHIKMLEARLDRLRAGTPQRPRRRPQPRLNGYASTSNLSSSFSSFNPLSSSARQAFSRQRTHLTPDREPANYPLPPSEYGTPSRGFSSSSHTMSPVGSIRPRSRSAGEDSFDYSLIHGVSRLDWVPGDENASVMLETIGILLRRLRDLNRKELGKGKDVERRDEVWDCLTRLGDMLKKSEPLRTGVSMDELLQSVLPHLADSSTVSRRAAGYRVLRYVMSRERWGKMLHAGLEWLLIRSFTRDNKAAREREQALRFLRTIVVLPPQPLPSVLQTHSSPTRSRHRSGSGHSRQPSGNDQRRDNYESRFPRLGPDPIDNLLENHVPLTDGLVRAIVSTAENAEDTLRIICMETLIEVALLDLRCIMQSDAFRTVLLTFSHGPAELGAATTGMLVYLINQPSTRHFLLPGSDLETVLVGLTEEYGKIPSHDQARQQDKLKKCVRNVGMLLNSWSGLLYLCMDQYRAIKSLVSSLHTTVPEVRDSILDLVFSTLRIKTPSWMNAFLNGKRLTLYTRTQEATSQLQDDSQEDEEIRVLNLVDHFTALLLAVYLEAGLLESLVSLIEDPNSELNRKATLLLGEILQMANRVLPLQYAAQLQSLNRFFAAATTFADPKTRHVALTALSSIDSLNRNQTKADKQASRDRSLATSNSDSLQRGQRQVQQVKLRMGFQIEDKQFQQTINDSGVLLDRNHQKWNYEVIMDLIEGPLRNPKRLDEAIKATKFIRRLFSFFHPFDNRFSAIKRTRPNHKWIRLGCALLSTMLVDPEGIRFISEDKLLPQMVDCFNELSQYPGTSTAQPVLARDRIENSLTYGYFEMIGTLSKHQEGVNLLDKFKFFTCFYHLSEQRSRDDIIRIIIECFDYTIDAHPRIVLSKALTSAYMETRLLATHHLGRLLHERPALADWALQLMITQLYDTTMEVCDAAVMYLEEVCAGSANLEKVVQLHPTLEHLGEIGHPLFMRFVSTSTGFRYLHQAGYIDRELETWLSERNLLYVIEVETFVSRTLRPFSTDHMEDYWAYDGIAPTHFFGELSKTPEGCQLLRERGLVAELAEIVRLHGMEAADQAVMTNVRSVLWALGNIGSTDGGLPFLEDEEIIEVIIDIASHSPVLTMKGTCFFVIGLISSTRTGAEILEEYGWISTRTPLGMTTGLCLPKDIAYFAHMEPWTRRELPMSSPPLPRLTGLEAEIMTLIANLSNYVIAASAMNNLKRIRNRHPRYFASITLVHRAIRMISTNHYTAQVRRFILDLFEISLESDTLVQLRHLEQASYSSPRMIQHGDGEYEARRRSASSPGPEPPGRVTRTRGLTISEMGPNMLESVVVDVGQLPREMVRGFGVIVR
ncbi:MAG: hypothetical protein TREMPRED_004194 [Tremellales sp. Tagirdzhanova-0007]|nr:MAG: hypothetical protein TREMPRED_004194 [Tremellales sp. Tagirdzhanova-0007]